MGILLYMSVMTLLSLRLYWRRSLLNDVVANVMIRNWFKHVLDLVHLSDNTQ